MGLRPKTARRLVLIGGLLLILVIGGLAALTIPGLQRKRNVESFRTDGLAAHAEGDHYNANSLLGKYSRAVGDDLADPEAMLAYARSRAALEAPRRQQFVVAAQFYRNYLVRVPADRDASKELVRVLLESGRFEEVVEEANKLRDSGISNLPRSDTGTLGPEKRAEANRLRAGAIAETPMAEAGLLRDELRARMHIDPADPLAAAIESRLLTEDTPAFEDLWRAWNRAYQLGARSTPPAVVRAYTDATSGNLGLQTLKIILGPIEEGFRPIEGSSSPDISDVIEPLTELYGYDPETGRLGDGVVLDDVELAKTVIHTFDVNGRTGIAADFTRAASEASGDAELIVRHAMRRFMMNDYETLLSIDVPEERRVELVDVVGYQAMAAAITDDAERVAELQRELESVNFQFQAKSWLDAFVGHEAMQNGDLVAARAALNKAIDRHTFEPTMPVMLGMVYRRMGFPADALVSWKEASFLAEPIVWVEPFYWRIVTLLATNRSLEADDLINEVLRESGYRQNAEVLMLRTTVSASLARRGQIGREEIFGAIGLGTQIREYVAGRQLAEIDVALGTMLASVGLTEEARAALSAVVADRGNTDLVIKAFEIDQRFGLGLSELLESPSLPARIDDPEFALSSAMTYCASGDHAERVPEAMAMIRAGVENASPADKARWLLVDAKFRSEFGVEGERAAWEAAVGADPDNIETLAVSVQSDTYKYDLEYVESVIAKIRELTASDGRTLSARLRLARAEAMFGTSPNSSERSSAIAIVRSIVAAEPRNTLARRMLANMLMFVCRPEIPEGERFTPDYPGAIEQLKTLASQIEGVESVGHLLEVVRLAWLRGDDEEAEDAMAEIARRASDNDSIAIRFAEELHQLGDYQGSARMLEDLFARMDGRVKTSIGLLLAQTYDTMEDSESSARVLNELASGGSLGVDEINELTARMHLLGMTDEAEAFVADTSRFGLDEGDQTLVRAQYATRFGSPEQAERMLKDLVVLHPENIFAWETLANMLRRQGRVDEAAEVAQEGLIHHPGDANLEYMVLLASGDTGEATRSYLDSLLERSSGDETVSDARRADLRRQQDAFNEIETFERERAGMTPDQQIERLRAIESRFIKMPTVLRYTLAERHAAGEAPASLYRDASAAARQHPGDVGILKFAARSALDAGNPTQAAGFAASWRGLSNGSRVEPDLYAAEAARARDDHERALALLEPYLSEAFESPDEELNRQVLLFFGASEIELRGESAARARLEPLVGRSLGFRSTVWLDLAVTGTNTPEQAETWLAIADQAGLDDYLTRLAGVWLRLADRHESKRAEYMKRAIEIAERAVQRDPDDAAAVASQGFAMRALAELEPDAGWLARAEQKYLRAFEIVPDDLQFLFDAAMCAAGDSRPDDAVTHYKGLLADSRVTGLFQAAVRNNIAAQLTWGDRSQSELQEALSLADAAVAFQPLDAFLGTRGWVHFAMGNFGAAHADFEALTQSDPGSFEGYAGLAASMKSVPDGDQAAADRAWQRALTVRGDTVPNPAIANALSRIGLEVE